MLAGPLPGAGLAGSVLTLPLLGFGCLVTLFMERHYSHNQK